jgi:hypothetical protein
VSRAPEPIVDLRKTTVKVSQAFDAQIDPACRQLPEPMRDVTTG